MKAHIILAFLISGLSYGQTTLCGKKKNKKPNQSLFTKATTVVCDMVGESSDVEEVLEMYEGIEFFDDETVIEGYLVDIDALKPKTTQGTERKEELIQKFKGFAKSAQEEQQQEQKRLTRLREEQKIKGQREKQKKEKTAYENPAMQQEHNPNNSTDTGNKTDTSQKTPGFSFAWYHVACPATLAIACGAGAVYVYAKKKATRKNTETEQ